MELIKRYYYLFSNWVIDNFLGTFIECHTTEEIEKAREMQEITGADYHELLEFVRNNEKMSKEELLQRYYEEKEVLRNLEFHDGQN